jgi:hypothetical protein
MLATQRKKSSKVSIFSDMRNWGSFDFHGSNAMKLKNNKRGKAERERITARITTVQTATVTKNTTCSWLQQLLSSQFGFIIA